MTLFIQQTSTPATFRLPLRSDWILTEERIGCEQNTTVHDSLTDQQPIERVAMKRRKFVQVNHRPFILRQDRDPMQLRCADTNRSSGAGTGSFPSECVTEITHTDTTLSRTSDVNILTPG